MPIAIAVVLVAGGIWIPRSQAQDLVFKDWYLAPATATRQAQLFAQGQEPSTQVIKMKLNE